MNTINWYNEELLAQQKAKINSKELGYYIFNIIPKWQVHHIRLWLNINVSQKEFNYFGFRLPFKDLSREEKTDFREKGQNFINQKQEERTREAVIPCSLFEEKSNGIKVYEAYLENIYFSNGFYSLKKEDGQFTNRLEEELSGSGYNRIPTSSPYNNIPFVLSVKSNEIINKYPLKELFSKVHTGEIEKVLLRIKNGEELNSKESQNIPYIENTNLRGKIIAYLEANQATEPTIIRESKNYARTMYETSKRSFYENTKLFTLRIDGDKAIIWENIDYTESRATYVFKSSDKDYNQQLELIKKAITTLGNLRSALNSKKHSSSELLGRKLGFAGKLKKERGKVGAFENWLNNLNKKIETPIPPKLTDSELIELENSPTIENKRTSHIRKKSKYSNTSSIKKVDVVKTFGGSKKKPEESNHNILEVLAKELQSFNDSILKSLNID